MKNGPYELVKPPADYPGKRYRGRYAYEHRVVWWQKTGQNPDEFPDHNIHHIDENKRNNDPANLEMIEGAEHSSHHHGTGETMVLMVCGHCERDFEVELRNSHTRRFCSRRCIGLSTGFSPVAQSVVATSWWLHSRRELRMVARRLAAKK
jgi:hypothetical protein